MMDFVLFMFSSFWVFAGFMAILMTGGLIATMCIAVACDAFRPVVIKRGCGQCGKEYEEEVSSGSDVP